LQGLGESLCRVVLRDVVQVAHRRLNVGVAHEALDVVQRERLRGQGAERVP
jgi:hypothetical protein